MASRGPTPGQGCSIVLSGLALMLGSCAFAYFPIEFLRLIGMIAALTGLAMVPVGVVWGVVGLFRRKEPPAID